MKDNKKRGKIKVVWEYEKDREPEERLRKIFEIIMSVEEKEKDKNSNS